MIRDTSLQDKQISGKSSTSSAKKLLITITLVVACAFLLISKQWVNAYTQSSTSVEKDRLRIAKVSRGDFIRDVSVQGRVIAATRPTLFSPAVGTIELMVRSGDKVALDQTLALIKSPELESEIEQELATLQSLEIEVSRQSISNKLAKLSYEQNVDLTEVKKLAAQRELRRAELSMASQVISVIDYEKSKDDLSTAKMEFRHAKAESTLQAERMDFELQVKKLELERQRLKVKELNRQLEELEIKSPVDGMVGDLLVEPQSAVTANQELMLVVDLTDLEIEVDIPESYADDLDFGMEAEVMLNQKAYGGTLVAISPEVKNNRVTGTIRFDDQYPTGMRQNQQLSTRIIIESKKDVLKIRRGPFLQSGSGRYTYKIHDQLATRTPITVGATSINEVEILAGANAGDELVISDLSLLGDAKSVLLTQ